MKAKPFWDCVEKGAGRNDCWLWKASKDKDGYGTKRWWRGRKISAHVLSYEMKYGPVPKGLCVLHKCDVPACVRPSHLFLGTQADNMRDMNAKGRGRLGIRNSEKTHCPKGHPYDDENTRYRNRQRFCRACCRESNRSHRRRKDELSVSA